MTEETPGPEQTVSEPAEPDGEPPTTDSQDHHCPECERPTIPGSDKCQHCGAPLDTGTGFSVELWEWGGALIAGFGFFLTPVVPGPIALYCAYRVYDYKPKAAYGILVVIIASIVFWIVLPVLILPS